MGLEILELEELADDGVVGREEEGGAEGGEDVAVRGEAVLHPVERRVRGQELTSQLTMCRV